MICPEQRIWGPTFVKTAKKIRQLGFYCKQQRPIWTGEIECGECVDEEGLKKLVIVCKGEKGCWAETRLVEPISKLVLVALDSALIEIARYSRYLPDTIVPRELKILAKALPAVELPEKYRPEILLEVIKAVARKRKLNPAVPFVSQ